MSRNFHYVEGFSDGLAVVQLEIGGLFLANDGKRQYKSSRFGYVDMSGKVVLDLPYDDVRNFVDGMAPVRIGDRHDDKYYYPGKFGFIDKTGKLVVAPQFDHVSNSFSEGLAMVKVGKNWGFIDKSRTVVINPTFIDVDDFSEQLAAAKKNGKWGYIDRTGNFVIKPQFFRAKNFSDGMASVALKQYGKWGYIDKTGKLVIEPKYNDGIAFKQGRASVREFKNNQFFTYCINKSDQQLPPADCSEQRKSFPIWKEVDGKKLVVDETGKILFENKWEYRVGFHNGVALVFNSSKNKYWCGLHVPGWVSITDACFNWGYINLKGEYIWKQPDL